MVKTELGKFLPLKPQASSLKSQNTGVEKSVVAKTNHRSTQVNTGRTELGKFQTRLVYGDGKLIGSYGCHRIRKRVTSCSVENIIAQTPEDGNVVDECNEVEFAALRPVTSRFYLVAEATLV